MVPKIMHKCSLKRVLIFLIFINHFLPSSHVSATTNNNGPERGPPNGGEIRKLYKRYHKRRLSRASDTHKTPFEVHLRTIWQAGDGLLLDTSGRVLDPKLIKSLLKDLLLKLDGNHSETFSTTSLSMFPPTDHRRHRGGQTSSTLLTGHSKRHINSLSPPHHYCSLHGLWLSSIAGAAIELRPERQANHVEIHTKVFDLPDNPYPPLLTSQWTGTGIISQESRTTLTIVFQEHIDGEKENHARERDSGPEPGDRDPSPIVIQLPRTAVFVGQCLVCHGNPMLQGSWLVFPSTQTCGAAQGFSPGINNGFNGNEQQGLSQSGAPVKDTFYLLRYL